MRITDGYLRRCRIVGKGWRPQGESHLCGGRNSKEKRRLRPDPVEYQV